MLLCSLQQRLSCQHVSHYAVILSLHPSKACDHVREVAVLSSVKITSFYKYPQRLVLFLQNVMNTFPCILFVAIIVSNFPCLLHAIKPVIPGQRSENQQRLYPVPSLQNQLFILAKKAVFVRQFVFRLQHRF